MTDGFRYLGWIALFLFHSNRFGSSPDKAAEFATKWSRHGWESL